MDIWGFLSHFQKGLSRPNRYRVEFNLPKGIPIQGALGSNPDASSGSIMQWEKFFNGIGGINIKCHTMTFPQRSVLTQEIRQNAAPFRTPYTASYDPITFSFYNNSRMDVRDYFEIWQSAVLNLGTNTMNFYDEYVSDIKMVMLDMQGNDAYGVTLYEAWPLNIGILDASYANSNAYTTTVVTMAYKSWAPFNNDQTGSGAASTV